MVFPEELEYFGITDNVGVIDRKNYFVVSRQPTTNFFIGGVARESSGITDRCC
jgi:hypothetical protein